MRTVHPTNVYGRAAERGIALLLVIFALLLLTAVTTAMLFSSNTETTIATNFRDKSISNYAVTSALQEGRDRIQPLSGDLGIAGYVPTDLPGNAKGQVLYIINPLAGETVAPWDPKNAYADTELCQEANMAKLGITVNTPGSPCDPKTKIPSPHKCDPVGTAPSGWCTFTTAWPQGTPLDYKWVRITLKADESTPVWVQTPGSPATGNTEVCWDSNLHQQLQKPASAGIDCLGAMSGSPVKSVTVNTNGTGYTSTPTVSFVGGGGSGATATAVVSATAGGIQSTTLSNKGSGYTSAPTVALVSPDGSGAAFSALITGSPITGLAMGTSNYCYPTGTTGLGVAFIPTPPPTAGGTATATVTMTGQACVTSATINAACGKSMKGKPLTISISGGFSANITLDNSGKYSGPVTPTNVGSYATVPSPQSVTVSGCSIPITSFNGGIQVKNLTLSSGGEYVSAPTATMQGTKPVAPSAAQPPVSVSWTAGASNGRLNSVSVATTGSGYAMPTYTLSITGGGGSGAAGTAASGATFHVTAINVPPGGGGSGYTGPPLVVISGPGAGATATAILQGGQKLLYGRVYMLTAMSQTQSGTKSMAQMELGVAPPWNFQLGGALTIAGANPTFGTPNSNIFKINGNDVAGTGTEPSSCDNTPANSLPAIGVYDTAAQSCIISGGTTCGTGLGKANNYTGAQSAPDVYVTAAANPDPAELQTMVDDISSTPGAQLVTGPQTYNDWMVGSATNLQTVVVNGDLTLGGHPSGYGVLVVTGNLTLNGDFTWHGVVLVLGAANVNNLGGGSGQITGAFYVANDKGSSLGSSTFNWNGGGGNGIQYDHCWADDLLNKYPSTASDKALQVLSTRMLQF